MISNLFLIIIFFFLLLLTISQAAAIITIPLTHHHSFSSPTYNHSHSIIDRAQFDFHSSIDRAAYYADHSSYSPSLYLRSRLTGGGEITGFVADMEVGSQGLKQQVVMDTGSGLLWINCVPSDFEVPRPVFDPMSSTSYRIADCNVSAACRFPGPVRIKCSSGNPLPKNNVCRFYARYGKDKTASGKLFVENFKFENNTQVLHDMVFGCSTWTNFYGANGILGLTKSCISILQQNEYTKFSYCIGDVNDQSYPHNKLILGDILMANYAETPIITEKDHRYYLNLEAIFFDSYKLDFDPAVLRRNPDNYFGGMIVDSGSTHTFIRQVVYDKFEEVVVAELEDELNYRERNYSFKYKEESIRLCYNGVFTTDLTLFPTVRFQFQGGAVMKFGTKSLFQQVTQENFCLAVMPIEWAAEGSTISILGNLMQQYTYLGFDLDTDKLAFQQDADCSLIG